MRCEAQRLVVVGLEAGAARCRPRRRRSRRGGAAASPGRGIACMPVERVREVDEPALLADRRDRVGERHPARDLLLEEEPDHLALVVGLDLLAGDHDQVAVAGELDGLERAAEDVVVGDRDRAEPSASAWSISSSGSIEQSCDQSVCMCRSARIQSRSPSGSPSGAVLASRRLRARLRVERRRAASATTVEALRLGAACRLRARASAERVVLGEPRERGGGELGLLGRPAGRRSRSRRGRLEQRDARCRPAPARRSPPRRASTRALAAARASATCARSRSRARDRGPAGSGFVCAGARAPSPGASRSSAEQRARDGALPGGPARRRSGCASSPGAKSVGVDAERDRSVVAREALGGALDGSGGGAEQRVDPGEQPSRCVLRGGIAEPLGREEGRGGERLGLEQREVREAREARLEAVDDVEAADARARREVRANAHRDARARPPRDRDGGAERDDVADRRRAAARAGPRARSRARDDGASTVTVVAAARSAAAAPRRAR